MQKKIQLVSEEHAVTHPLKAESKNIEPHLVQ